MNAHLAGLAALAVALAHPPAVQAGDAPKAAAPPLSAAASEPARMGWMQGFPPAADKRLSAADGSFFRFPALRYSVVHMREFLPTVNVSRGLGAPVPFEYAVDPAIDALGFQPWGARKPMTWRDSLAANYTDGILVLHHGKVVYERYLAELRPDRVHAAMSVTKSITGLLAAMLIAEGRLDPQAKVTQYLPELEGSAFVGASVRQVLDMTTCLAYSEDYADPQAEVWAYAAASNPFPRGDGPIGTDAYLRTLKPQPDCRPGAVFAYKTPNADVVGWIVARVSGRSVADLLAERVWSRLGMEQAAYFQVDGVGTPVAGGGFSAGLRDMARLGQMILDGGLWHGQRILPAAAIAEIRKGGSRQAFARSGHDALKGWSYHDLWWHTHDASGAFAARGVHGQTLYIDPAADMVIVRFASTPQAANAANDPTSLPAYRAVAEHLMGRGASARGAPGGNR